MSFRDNGQRICVTRQRTDQPLSLKGTGFSPYMTGVESTKALAAGGRLSPHSPGPPLFPQPSKATPST